MSRKLSPQAAAPKGGTKMLYLAQCDSCEQGKKHKVPEECGPQVQLMLSTAQEILYGGAAGGGKSYGLRMMLVNYCLQYPGARVVLFRRTFRELEDTHISMLLTEIPSYVATYHVGSHEFRFQNGSTLLLRFCEKEDDVYSYDTFEADMMAFDELTAFTQLQYSYLFTRCRSSKKWWPGRKIISATNPGNTGHCVPYGEVLTTTGWKNISFITEGDIIASLDDKDKLVYLPVDHTCSHSYSGNLLVSDSNTAHIACTPYHKIARRTETKNANGRVFHSVSLVAASDLSSVTRLVRSANWDQEETDWGVQLPTISTSEQPKFLSGDLYCELLGWMVSEGYTVPRDRMFGIAQSKLAGRDAIRDLLIRCGFHFNENKDSFTVYSPEWYEHFKSLGKSREKNIPRFVFEKASKRQLTLIMETAFMGDGHEKVYYTISKQLANDMQELGFKLGFSPRIRSRQRLARRGLSYEVTFKSGRLGWLEKSSFKSIDYTGPVYCLGIKDLHRFFIRQNGSIWLSGNSWVMRRFIEALEPYEIKQGPDDEGGLMRQFIPAKFDDNPALARNDPDYIKALRALPTELYRAKALGDWHVFSGQYFSRWRDSVHVVKKFSVPADWTRYITVDWGIYSPHAVYWAARPPGTSTLYVYREQYGRNVATAEQARRAREKTVAADEKIEFGVGDPAMWAKERDAHGNYLESNASYWINEFAGICEFQKGNNERLMGASLMMEMLDWQGVEDLDSINVVKPPRLFFMDNCPEAIRTIRSLVHDKLNPEDVDTTGEDHAYDAIRYLVRAMFQTPKKPQHARYIIDSRGAIAIIAA